MPMDSDILAHHNNHDKDTEDWGEAEQFIIDLRTQLKRIDSNLDENICDLRTNKKKNVMYINGTSQYEIYMWVMYDYLHSIPGISNIEFKLPQFGLEAIEFKFDEESEVELSDIILKNCFDTRLKSYKNKTELVKKMN